MNITKKKEHFYTLIWEGDFSNSEKFYDLYEALFAFDNALLSREWNSGNIDKALFLRSAKKQELMENGEGQLHSIDIAVGIAAVEEDTECFENIDTFYVAAVNNTFDNKHSIRETLQEISMTAYYVDTLHKEEAA